MNKLQKALRLNAMFSGISGVLLTILYNRIATLFGIENTSVFWIVGIVLIYFSITIWYEIFKQRKLAVQWIIIQDFVWVLGSVFLLVYDPFKITYYGNMSIATIAVVVLFMGINQFVALRSTYKKC